MKSPQENKERISKLIAILPNLSGGQISILEKIIDIFSKPQNRHRTPKSDIVSDAILNDFGDALMVHHSFSKQPFTKDKFEYVLESVLNSGGRKATLAPRGNPGYDITIDEVRFSLKTQADKNIRVDAIHISKFMELGGGQWGDKLEDLEGLRNQFLNHLKKYDRILTLRALKNEPPDYVYELVEIPKTLLLKAKSGRFEMRMESTQMPKPGYCYVEEKGQPLFELYFDGGGERKLQIKNLRKTLCSVHATWDFSGEGRLIAEEGRG